MSTIFGKYEGAGLPDVEEFERRFAELTGRVDTTLAGNDAKFVASDLARALAAFGEVQRGMLQMGPVLRPTQGFIDACMRGKVTIVVPADSISAGADALYPNGWVQNFTQMLQLQMPWIDWNVINLSIGGRNMINLADPLFQSPGEFSFSPNLGGPSSQWWPDGTPTPLKAWRDYVRDCEPDLIIMAHQENQGTSVPALQNAFEAFRDYSATWAKKPWFAFVSGALPTTNPAAGDGQYLAAQTGRQALADWNRHTAIYNGYGLIDCNGLFRMLRDGRRTETAPFVVERDFRYWGTEAWYTVQGAAPVLDGGMMTFAEPATLIQRRGNGARDIDICCDFIPNAGAVTRLSYRQTDDTNQNSGYTVQYTQDNGLLKLYSGVAEIGAWNIAPAATHNLRVKATGPLHEVFLNGKRVLKVIHHAGSFAGSVSLGYAVGAGKIASFHLCAAREFVAAPAYATEQDLLGAGDWLTNPSSGGGDGIHHPSVKGIFAFYLPAVQVFIDQLKTIFNRSATVTAGRSSAAISAPVDAAFAAIDGTECTVTIPVTRQVMVNIALGYRNAGQVSGVLRLMIDGALYESFYLPQTTGDDNHPFSTTIPVLLGSGTHAFALAWGGTPPGQAAMTSGGGGGARTLAVTVQAA